MSGKFFRDWIWKMILNFFYFFSGKYVRNVYMIEIQENLNRFDYLIGRDIKKFVKMITSFLDG